MFDFSQPVIDMVLGVGSVLSLIIVTILSLLAALIGLGMGVRYFVSFVVGDGTTTKFSGSLHKYLPAIAARWDHLTYRPYKGYNRLRSRSWNMNHMPDGM